MRRPGRGSGRQVADPALVVCACALARRNEAAVGQLQSTAKSTLVYGAAFGLVFGRTQVFIQHQTATAPYVDTAVRALSTRLAVATRPAWFYVSPAPLLLLAQVSLAPAGEPAAAAGAAVRRGGAAPPPGRLRSGARSGGGGGGGGGGGCRAGRWRAGGTGPGGRVPGGLRGGGAAAAGAVRRAAAGGRRWTTRHKLTRSLTAGP